MDYVAGENRTLVVVQLHKVPSTSVFFKKEVLFVEKKWRSSLGRFSQIWL
jgi:hypothetical protein